MEVLLLQEALLLRQKCIPLECREADSAGVRPRPDASSQDIFVVSEVLKIHTVALNEIPPDPGRLRVPL